MAWGVPPRPPSSKVQALYELCKRTFPSPSAAGAGASPSPPLADAVRSISSLMGNALLPAANFDPFPFLPLRCGLWACCDSLMARPRLAQVFILFHYATAIKKKSGLALSHALSYDGMVCVMFRHNHSCGCWAQR